MVRLYRPGCTQMSFFAYNSNSTSNSHITMQIKRTRLRLVAYIQRLSRAAYLLGRYLFHLMAGQPLREKTAEQFFREKIAKQWTLYICLCPSACLHQPRCTSRGATFRKKIAEQ